MTREEKQKAIDAISRQAVLDHIYGINGLEGFELSNVFEKHYADFIKSLPSVTPQQKTGKWVKVHPLQADDVGAYMCSYCKVGDWNLKGTEKFCPNCGAKMLEVI